MGINRYVTLKCDNEGCDYASPLMEFVVKYSESEEEEIRASAGFSYIDTPFSIIQIYIFATSA